MDVASKRKATTAPPAAVTPKRITAGRGDDHPPCPALDNDILSKVFLFTDAQDVSVIARTSTSWKQILETVQEEVWKSNFQARNPLLSKFASPNISWKLLFQHQVTSTYQARGVNQQLQKDFDTIFFHEGLLAFSNCCHYGCSHAYGAHDIRFQPREGIYFIRLHLNGMNYDDGATMVAASYADYDYLDEHWDAERDMLVRWCGILGLEEGEFDIEKPGGIETCVAIHFKKPLELEHWSVSDGDY